MVNVKLRALSVDDTSNIVRWRNSDYVRTNLYNQALLSEQSQLQYFKKYVVSGLVRQYIIVAVDDVSETDIGTVFFKNITDKNAEIGIFIGEKTFLGNGYGAAALKEALKVAFSEIQLETVYAQIKNNNFGSYKLFVKAGFEDIGVEEMTHFENILYEDSRIVKIKKQGWMETFC